MHHLDPVHIGQKKTLRARQIGPEWLQQRPELLLVVIRAGYLE